jgi:hypothetical protein
MRSHNAGTAPRQPALAAPRAPTGEWRQTVLAGEVAHEINRSLDVVVGNIGLLATQLDPDSDARARAWRALDEAKRIREMMSERAPVTRIPTWDRLRAIRSLLGGGSARGGRRTRSAVA